MPNQRYAHMTVRRGASFSAYLLESEDMFSPADYKLLNGQHGTGLIPCLRSRFNGFPKLTYFPDRLVPISSCLTDISQGQFMALVSSLIHVILHVESNGLLDVCKIDISAEAFYINVETYDAGIVYLPINQKISGKGSEGAFNLFCQAMLALITEHDQLRELIRVFAGFANTSMGRFGVLSQKIEAAYPSNIYKEAISAVVEEEIDSRLVPPSLVTPLSAGVAYRLTGRVGMMPIGINVPVGECVVVGKSKANAGYTIPNVPTISNRHCELRAYDHKLVVKDLGSTNGTFVNGSRLSAHASCELRAGDKLGVSSVVLVVSEVAL